MSAPYLATSQPDILEVIANLSNDAVFTPPRVVNAALDLLPAEVWSDRTLRWLDPGSKTGVFPREITKRLMTGLAGVIPDDEERLTHILTQMVHAVATEEVTGMMTRLSLYCSKDASSHLSAVPFAHSDGNVWLKRVEHVFGTRRRCMECGGVESQLEKPGLDNKAYAFIHEGGLAKLKKELDMHFDIIVGNPPYQMTDGGPGGSASPIYQKFIETAISLNPDHIVMIVPSKWMVGGKGLNDFRARMIADRRLKEIVDFQNAQKLFPVINLTGGINYFLWSADYAGECRYTYHFANETPTTTRRYLDEFDVVVRDNVALEILHKVLARGEPSFESRVSSQKPFGMRTDFRGSPKPPRDPVRLFQNGGTAWVSRGSIDTNEPWVDQWKVLVPAASDGNEIYPLPVLSNPIIAEPGTACTETYLVIGPWKGKKQCDAVVSYINTRFFRFMLNLRKPAQHNSQEKFRFVPDLPMTQMWTDGELFERYGLSEDEIAHIGAVVREQ